ncbi:MAG: MGMT family protein [archaeon]
MKGIGTDFQKKVWRATQRIPAGKVSTYARIAKAIGKPNAARAVGNALNANPYAPKVPCHRVVKSSGEIGGFASGTQKKKKLLEGEGIRVKSGKVDLEKFHSFF